MSIKTCKQHANEPIFIYAQCAACEIQRYRNEVQSLKAENESLRKDAARFAYIEQDADSGMSKIYGDDWIAVIDAAISSPENP